MWLTYLLMVLTAVGGKPTTVKVGRMLAPTSYGQIHFFKKLEVEDLRGRYKEELRVMNVSLWASGAPPDIHLKFNRLVQGTYVKLDRLDRRTERVKALTNPIQGNVRKKRAVFILAGAALAAGVVIALGLGVANTAQIFDLTNKIERMQGEADELLVAVRAIETQVETGLKEANRSILHNQWDRFLQKEAARIRWEVEKVEKETDDWERGFFHVLQGTLDPAFVSIPDLERGLDIMRKQARKYGMKIAPFETPLEVFFTMPVSVVLNATGVHLFVSVPMIPVNVPVFDLIKVSHPPIHVVGDRFLELRTSEVYLAIDSQRKLSKEVTPTELAACERHKATFLCSRFNTFSTTHDSCAAGLMFGDKDVVKQKCHQVITRHELVVTPAAEYDVEVYSLADEVIVKVCPGVESTPLERVTGRRHVNLTAGCYLRTKTSTTFMTHVVPAQNVPCAETEWTGDDFLADLQDVQDVLAHIKLTNHNVDIRSLTLPPRVWMTNNQLTLSSIGSLAIVTITAAVLIWRLISVARKRRNRDADE